jgi:hypothetical protein
MRRDGITEAQASNCQHHRNCALVRAAARSFYAGDTNDQYSWLQAKVVSPKSHIYIRLSSLSRDAVSDLDLSLGSKRSMNSSEAFGYGSSSVFFAAA